MSAARGTEEIGKMSSRKVKCLKCGYTWLSGAKSPRCHQGRIIVTTKEGCSGYTVEEGDA